MSMAAGPKSRRPYDVLVAPNLYGDILSDMVRTGRRPGRSPRANLSADLALFEATHGSAPKICGNEQSQPHGNDAFRHVDAPPPREKEAGDRLEKAVAAVIAEGKDVTYDFKPGNPGKAVGTSQVADAVIRKLQRV